MGKKIKEVPVPIRDLIIQSWRGQLSERKIAQKYNLANTTVHNIITKFKKTGEIKN
jgi:hypothetical protein